MDNQTDEIQVDKDALASHVGFLIESCETYSNEQEPDRKKALEYYDGEMTDLPAEEDFSQVMSKDVRKAVKKVMPSVMRTLLSNDKIVEYDPVNEGDEETAKQASNYVNHSIVPECGVEDAVYDAIFDAAILKTGILKWTAYQRREVVVQEYTGQPEDALLGLDQDDGMEVYEIVENPVTDPQMLEVDPEAKTYDFKVRFQKYCTDIRLEAVPRGSFLIHPRSEDIDDSPIVGERQTLTRSELVKRGYDKDIIKNLGMSNQSDDDDTMARMGDDWTEKASMLSKSMEEIDIYEVYVRLDMDNDGIAELYRIVYCPFGGDEGEDDKKTILEMEPVQEAPYSKVVIEREAHQFEGHSLAEDMIEIQKIKTALLRNGLDNIYWQNDPMSFVDFSAVQDPEELYKPKFGKPIELKAGKNAQQAFQTVQIPLVASAAFDAMQVFDQEGVETTGITDSSGGLDAEAIQNVAATTANIMNDKGTAQAEMLIRSVARGGIKKAFRGLLKLVIAHSDGEKRIRINKQWQTFDPRTWNVDMDCSVNIGLGAGSRERDLQVLQMLLGLQQQIIQAMGPDNPYVKPNQLYNTLARMTEAAGFASAEPYFTEPSTEEIEAKMAELANQPDPEEKKAQMQMQIAQAQAAAKSQVENAQMQADLQVKKAELEKDAQLEMLKATHKRDTDMLKAELDLLKHRDKMELEWAKTGVPQQPSLDVPFVPGTVYEHGQ